ncbi:Nif3-like dinuclear metal center hexameric protein [Psychrosphaera sp. 1_MG-2023]|uniref:Nif3-like dinuclear metal center hexameric protein n=1 Tax=unclassified Psychrosphaera TaxID=2641570 RepID=UPI002091C3E7|nr:MULTISPECIES: Nif3-like dinuclear metal center hexameric protein [unclassified Psychrosphaera]MDO6720028.1 Nif3-like dinuclear metal center hexameric protein [Psychrosphaera sp. 1_MG-2023]
MTIQRNELMKYLNDFLNIQNINDYCPNGLQVEGTQEIKKIVTGVTASQALIDAAIAVDADLLLVHHGYFWKGEAQPIVGLKRNRIKSLLVNDINLVGYHLPLDVHSSLGNNKQLGELLGLTQIEPITHISPSGVVYRGVLPTPMTANDFATHINSVLARTPLVEQTSEQLITHVAWCTGGGQGYLDAVVELGIDAFVSGEVSEQTIHNARENQIHFFAAGHHATERYGVKALGEHIQREFNVDVQFIDINNPA